MLVVERKKCLFSIHLLQSFDFARFLSILVFCEICNQLGAFRNQKNMHMKTKKRIEYFKLEREKVK